MIHKSFFAKGSEIDFSNVCVHVIQLHVLSSVPIFNHFVLEVDEFSTTMLV